MRYSTHVKQAALEKLLRPDGPRVLDLSAEFGIPEATLYGWRRLVRNGRMTSKANSARHWTLEEKLRALLEGRGKSEEELGTWLRENGLHEADLARLEKEIAAALGALREHADREREHGRQLKTLEMELRRKERALAEMAAIVTLKKKLGMWEDEEPGR